MRKWRKIGGNWRRENQRTACDQVHTATINSHPAVRPKWSHRRVVFVIESKTDFVAECNWHSEPFEIDDK